MYYKKFECARLLAEKMQLCSHKLIFKAKGLPFAKLCERTFEGAPFYGGGGRRYYKIFEICKYFHKKKRPVGRFFVKSLSR